MNKNFAKDNLSNSEVNNPNSNNKDIALHDIILKQHEMLLKQYEVLAKEKEQEEDEIDLTRLIPSFLKKKKTESIAPTETTPKQIQEKNTAELPHTSTNLNWFTRAGINYINGIKTYWVLILVLVGLSGAYGVNTFFNADPTYESHMTLMTENKDYKEVYRGLISTLDELAITESDATLAKKIGISEEKASFILGIQYHDYLQKEDSVINDSTIIKAPISPYFKINVQVKDNSVLPGLNAGLYDLLTENEPLDNRVKAEQKMLKQSLKDLDAEKALMDSLRQVVMTRISDTEEQKNDFYVKQSGIDNGGGLILSENRKLEIAPTLPFDKLKEIDAQKRAITKKLELMEYKLQVIENFAAINKPIYPRLRHLLFPIVLAFAVGTVLTSVLYSFKKKKIA